ncbi:MAG: hypothetical protein KAW87_08260 [Candidatus Cloacimonetes bacterium]|nr:hypothetical protein [Candidatus Cloacimonadota bacterium]
MKIPNKIKVAGHYYKVKFDDKGLAKEHLIGQTNNDFKEIRLCKHYKSKRARARSEIEETFMHEMLHTVDKNYNNASLTEKAVDRLSQGLYQVLHDNFTIRKR